MADAAQAADWTPLDSYLVGKHGLHIHVFGFAFGLDNERRNMCLSSAEWLVEGRTPLRHQHSMLIEVGERAELCERKMGGVLWHELVRLRLDLFYAPFELPLT
ncbi:MAG TPA: hypothetical protein VF504_01070 [Solirubrobacterales bacterium]